MALSLVPAPENKELLVHVVDRRAKDTPSAIYAEYPISPTGYEEGFRKITFADLSNAINGVAWWLHNTLGPGKNFETLAYVGTLDFRYNTLLLGAVKAGYKVLFTSPRNSMLAHRNLFEILGCQILVCPNPQPQAVTSITATYEIRVLEIPSVEELLSTSCPSYPYNKTFAEARTDPLVVLHTSGTTGLPKPIIWSHDFASSWLQWILLEPPPGYRNQHELWYPGRLFFLFPPFHAAALFGSLLGAIFLGTTVIFPPAGVIPSAQILADALKHTTANCAAIVPLVADELSKSPDLLDFVSAHLDSMFYSGGNIGKAIGDKISEKIKFFSIIGTTETGLFPTLYPSYRWSQELWNYFHFNPASKIELQPVSDEEFEAVVVRNSEPESEQTVFKIFPDTTEYRTGDLYVPHQTIQDLWLYRGRSDDIIVFLTGEKTNPISMEASIAEHPEVRSVLVMGTLRFQAALLVELLTTEERSPSQRAEIIERLWPRVQQANLECPRHAQVRKSHIMLTTPDKPLLRAAKGTVQRKPTLELYAKEIDALYADAEKTSAVTNDNEAIASVDIQDSASVSNFIAESVACLLDAKNTHSEGNFFLSGMDSLQALELTRRLKAALNLPDLEISTVYANPSILTLTNAILKLSGHHKDYIESRQLSRSQVIEKLLVEYKALLHNVAFSQKTKVPRTEETLKNNGHGRVVLLTGSTGAIGSYILQVLLDTPDISHIYCLNRASDSHSLQVERNRTRTLPTEFPTSLVTFLSTDLSKDNLGLESPAYNRLQNSVTDIIHNAWPVNFNLSLETFAPHLAGTVNLLKLGVSATNPFTFLFVSSVSSVQGYSTQLVTEEIITNHKAPLPIGYAESKYIAERLLDHASTVLSNANIIVVRVGQITGPAHAPGHWNKWEWFPSLVTSSLHLRMLPDSLGNGLDVLYWVPIDFLASTLVEYVLESRADKESSVKVFHPVNPRPTSWSALRRVIVSVLERVSKAAGIPVKIEEVPLSTWIATLRTEARMIDGTSQLENMLQVNPAVKLVGFYEGLLTGAGLADVDGTHAIEASTSLKKLNGLNPEWLGRWVEDWVGSQ